VVCCLWEWLRHALGILSSFHTTVMGQTVRYSVFLVSLWIELQRHPLQKVNCCLPYSIEPVDHRCYPEYGQTGHVADACSGCEHGIWRCQVCPRHFNSSAAVTTRCAPTDRRLAIVFRECFWSECHISHSVRLTDVGGLNQPRLITYACNAIGAGTLLEVLNWIGHSSELSVMFR
jgi:hypothetical protein